MDGELRKAYEAAKKAGEEFEKQSDRTQKSLYQALGQVYVAGDQFWRASDEDKIELAKNEEIIQPDNNGNYKLSKPQRENPFNILTKITFPNSEKSVLSKYNKVLRYLLEKTDIKTAREAQEFIENAEYEDKRGLSAAYIIANDHYKPDNSKQRKERHSYAMERFSKKQGFASIEAPASVTGNYATLLARKNDNGELELVEVLEQDDSKIEQLIVTRYSPKPGAPVQDHPLYHLYEGISLCRKIAPKKIKGRERLVFLKNERFSSAENRGRIFAAYAGARGPFVEYVGGAFPNFPVEQMLFAEEGTPALTGEGLRYFEKEFKRINDWQVKDAATEGRLPSGTQYWVQGQNENGYNITAKFKSIAAIAENSIYGPQRGINFQISQDVSLETIKAYQAMLTEVRKYVTGVNKARKKGDASAQLSYATLIVNPKLSEWDKEQLGFEPKLALVVGYVDSEGAAKAAVHAVLPITVDDEVSLENISNGKKRARDWPAFQQTEVSNALQGFVKFGANNVNISLYIDGSKALLQLQGRDENKRLRVTIPSVMEGHDSYDQIGYDLLPWE